MRNYVLMIIFTALLISSVSTHASEALALKTVEDLYHGSLNLKNNKRDFDNNTLLEKASTVQLQKLWKADQDLIKRTNELGCIDYDLMWLNDGGSNNGKLSFKALGNDQVIVHIGESTGLKARSLIYQMQCNDQFCKVNDLILENDVSFKRVLSECLSVS
ncbi:hypothetical protein [Acinetobacter rudis]|uniref:hypothetical protein n=1 Tax=Acinetobacter rudis TaxID=632955 RepID=UPI00333FFB30